MRTVKLIFVEADENRNKWYHMKELTDGSWEATWGRVGNTGEQQIYPGNTWDKKYREKVKKGYKDVTHLFAEAVDNGDKDDGFQIANKAIMEFVTTLQSYAKKSVSTNYIVTSDQVTQKQIDEAQALIDELVTYIKIGSDTAKLNNRLIELYKVIPRKMKKVADHLVADITNKSSLEIAQQKIAEEQDLLDVMAGQVTLGGQQKTHKKGLTLADVGINIEATTDADVAKIKKMMTSESAGLFRKAWRVTNIKTQSFYDQQIERATVKYSELLWHGSRNENWWSIATTGLKIRPAGAIHTGSMFGDGIYGANKARKSIGYTSLNGSHWARGNANKAYLALYDFHLGNMLKTKVREGWMGSCTFDKLRQKGNYNSLYAMGGADLYNDEFIVYKENQTTIRYIVEIGK